jgi:hypothetical protein
MTAAARCAAPDILLGTIDKNTSERVHVQLRIWKQMHLVDIRIHYRSAVGEFRPSKEGVCLHVTELPELLALITEAEAEARRLGLLPE